MRGPKYEVVVVGGGPAGLTTAMYTTRLGHRTALVDREGGRYTAVSNVHNLVGVSEETSGREVTELAIRQLEAYGADYYDDSVHAAELVEGDDRRFRVRASHADLLTDRLVLATGFRDVEPSVPGLRRFTGRGLHYCLHCDAYTLGDGSVFVLGHDESAAEVAMLLLNFTADVDLLLDGETPSWDESVDEQVAGHPIDVVAETVVGAFPADEGADRPWLGGLSFADGTVREYLGGFAMYGKEYNDDLAVDLGCELDDDGSVAVDDRRETSVEGVYAVGDLTHGQNQTPIAMGDGAYAGIALHKDLRRFPLPVEELDGDLDAPAVPDDLRARMRRVRRRDDHPGMTPDGSGPTPDD